DPGMTPHQFHPEFASPAFCVRVRYPTYNSSLGLGDAGKSHQELAPIAFGVEDAPHLVAMRAIAIQISMLEFDPSVVPIVSNESHFNFRLKACIILPVGADVPREDESRGRFPCEHAPPLTHASVIAQFVPSAADMRLDDRVHRISLSNFVECQRPPRTHLLGEHLPRNHLRCSNAHHLAYSVWIESCGPRRLCHNFNSLTASRSATVLNALSASSQNPSSHLRIDSIPRVSTS